MTSTLLYHPAYQAYDFGPSHPFSPMRLAMLVALLEELGAAPDFIEPPCATRDDILTLHSEALVIQVEAASQGTPHADAQRFGLDTGDVPVFAGMDTATRTLVGGTLHGARLITSGTARRVLQLGGGLHHAQRALAAGFCVYNDPALAIHHFRSQGLRVAYLDVDVHHGDGVQELHYSDPGVMTISLHESGRHLYPGTGFVEELGEAEGKGFKLNIPLAPFTHDASYLEAFERVVPQALARFKPHVLVVECGADAHAADPLAHLLLTSHAYETLFRRILNLAETYTEDRVLLHLGGGYNLDATVRVWTLLALLVQNHTLPERLPKAWLRYWQRHIEQPLTPTLHDATSTITAPQKDIIAQKNRYQYEHLLALATPYWDAVQ